MSGKVCMRPLNWEPKPFLKSAAAAAAAFMALRSRFLHFARRFLNHTCNQQTYLIRCHSFLVQNLHRQLHNEEVHNECNADSRRK